MTLPTTMARPSARPALRRWLAVGGIGFVLLLGAILMVLAIGSELGLAGGLVGFATAVLPLGIVIPAVLWLDRFEAEPTRYLVITFLWGACVATAIALILNTGSMLVLSELAGKDAAEQVGSVIVAPVVEESFKGLGVLCVLVLRRREFDGVVDGIVYAAVCAAGFAFAENILYFGRSVLDGGTSQLAVVFLLRGLLGPFAHPLFTACTGVGLGYAASTSRGALRVLAPVAGLTCAILLHGLWNGAAVAGLQGLLTLYVFLQVPVFAGAVWFAVWARRREGRLIAEQLSVFAHQGLFQPAEVAMLASLPARRQAVAWAKTRGGSEAQRDMRHLQDWSSELAFLRYRMVRGTAPADAAWVEQALVSGIVAVRARLYGLPA